MRYMTGEELRKSLSWWLVLALFAVAVGVTYLRTLESSSFGFVTTRLNATYDYVIVGGGTEGCVLASRLSEDPRLSVLLLEAGGEETSDIWNHVPLWNPIQHGSQGDWGYYTTPQKYACKAMKNQQCAMSQARILGGSSLTNQMLYTRGSPHDLASWPTDDTRTWHYSNVLPYFLKSEDILDEDLKFSDFHSTNGPIPVSGPVTELSQLHEMFLSGARELKYKPTDCNGRHSIGFCRLATTVRDGERFSSAKNYLRHAMSRSNLHVSTHSHVTKILIAKNKAVGVEYVCNGQKRTVGTNKEVVLTAGAIGTAHLLLLSGIGPKEQLASIGVPLVADLPVGINLQEHLWYKIEVHTNQSIGITKENAFNAIAYLKYLALGKGWLSTGRGIFGHALLKTNSKSNMKLADVQLTFSAISENLSENKLNESSIKTIKSNDTSSPNLFTITVELLRPSSRGSVRLQSRNPFIAPLIDPNYLENRSDIDNMVKGIKIALLMLTTSPFTSLHAKIPDKHYSPCIQHKLKSDAYWECLLRHQAAGNGQSTSTCTMGPESGNQTVVDSQLRVVNVTNLRVADVSVMPSSVSGDMFATAVMIAEKASDLIRGHESVKWFRRLSDRAIKTL